jgi:hypothetical protein
MSYALLVMMNVFFLVQIDDLQAFEKGEANGGGHV